MGTLMWAGGIIIGIFCAIIGFLVKFSLDQLKESFRQLLSRIDKITDTLDKHNSDLIKVLSFNDVTQRFVDDHTDEIERIKEDIKNIQITCASSNHKRKTA
jgi:hypothetical protein